MQASTRTNQSTTYTEKEPYDDNGTNEEELYNMQTDPIQTSHPTMITSIGRNPCGNRTTWKATKTS